MSISRVISLIVIFFRHHGRGKAFLRIAACALLVSAHSSPVLAANTIVRMETSLGAFNIELYDDTPLTVANFLDNYVKSRTYDGTVIHRSIPGFITQGGGYTCCLFGYFTHIQPVQQVQNEPLHSNVRGTIAMAKKPLATDEFGNPVPGTGPDSATSEWFFNLADNNAPYDPNKPDDEQSLDYQNGGFTVFGHVLDTGMDVVDAIANTLPTSTQNAFDESYKSSILSNVPKLGSGFVFVNRVCINDDGDGVCSDTEDLAPGGSGNEDNIPDREQPNVATFLASLGGTATFSADAAMKFDIAGTIKKDVALSWLKTFTSPPDQSVHFNNGMFRFLMTGTMGTTKHVVALHDGAATRPTHYYAYGKTPDNQTDHWYDFSYDGGTGAEIDGDKIFLHFKDGQRGDEDLQENGSITHTGAQAVVTTTSTDSGAAQPGGCSITTTPAGMSRSGDWILVSLFLTILALTRRYGRRR